MRPMNISPTPRDAGATRPLKRAWETPELRPVGTLGALLRGGNGKLTTVTGDPGEPRKVPGNDF